MRLGRSIAAVILATISLGVVAIIFDYINSELARGGREPMLPVHGEYMFFYPSIVCLAAFIAAIMAVIVMSIGTGKGQAVKREATPKKAKVIAKATRTKPAKAKPTKAKAKPIEGVDTSPVDLDDMPGFDFEKATKEIKGQGQKGGKQE